MKPNNSGSEDGAAPTGPNPAEARALALGLLARREHTAGELLTKLQRKGVAADLAETLISELKAKGVVSDARFAEIYCRQRVAARKGPRRIRAELAGKGVAEAEIRQALEDLDTDFYAEAQAWARRAWSGRGDQREKARLYRGGLQRGFTHDQVMRAIEQLFREAQAGPDGGHGES